MPRSTVAAVFAVAAIVVGAPGCASDGTASGSGAMAIVTPGAGAAQPSLPAIGATGQQPQVAPGTGTDDGGDSAGSGPSSSPDDGPVRTTPAQSSDRGARAATPAAEANPATGVADATTAAYGALEPMAPTIAALIRSWDDTNRAIYEADTTSFERVAAELEQVSAEATDSVGQVSWARLNDGAVLAGLTADDGTVISIVAIAGVSSPRDRVVALTTLALVLGPDRFDAATQTYDETAGGGLGDVEAISGDDGVVAVLQRLELGGGAVSIVALRGVDPVAAEALAADLVPVVSAIADA